MRRLTRLMFASTLAGILASCQPPAPPPGSSPPPRPVSFFDEKLKCATVGERWKKLMCESDGKRLQRCHGWWAYHPQRDTCVGVFHIITVTRARNPDERPSRDELLFVLDMLTNVELEDMCMASCDPEAAKKRWITPDVRP